MKRVINISLAVLLFFCCVFVCTLPVCAAEGAVDEAELGTAWAELAGVLPPEVAALLPAGLFHH